MFPTGIAERLIDRHRRLVVLHHQFRMPLDAERERRREECDRFRSEISERDYEWYLRAV